MNAVMLLGRYPGADPAHLRELVGDLDRAEGWELWVTSHRGALNVVARVGPASYRGVMRIPWAWVDGIEHNASVTHEPNEVTGEEARPGDVRGCPPTCPLRIAVEEELGAVGEVTT